MGESAVLSTAMYNEPLLTSLNLSNIDPTIIKRLHAILSGQDIFEISEKSQYKISTVSSGVIKIVLPENLKKLILEIKNSKIDRIAHEWLKSAEVNLSQWSKLKTVRYLEKLIEYCKSVEGPVSVNMHLSQKLPFSI